MSPPDETLKLQRRLSHWSGTKKISRWLMLTAFGLAIVSVAFATKNGESITQAVSPPFLLVSLCALLWAQATTKIRAIEAELSS